MARIEAKTDREILIDMDGRMELMSEKIDAFKDSLREIVVAFNKMETERINDHEKRIVLLEKAENEKIGAYKFLVGAAVVIGIAVSILTIKSFMK